MKTITFFLGSGCSFPSGQPSVAKITSELFSQELYLKESLDPEDMFMNGLIDPLPVWTTKTGLGREAAHLSRRRLEPWRKPASSIRKYINYFASLRKIWPTQPNYEDLSGALRRMLTATEQQSNDPFLHFFLQSYNMFSKLDYVDFPEGHYVSWWKYTHPLRRLELIDDYIGWVTAHCILLDPPLLGYQAFAHAIKKLSRLGIRVCVVTTNYDCNLERLLQSSKLNYHDGITYELTKDSLDRDWKLWKGFNFSNESPVLLLKLHGSINWHVLRNISESGPYCYASCPTGLSPDHAHGASLIVSNRSRFEPYGSPLMLRGSLSKDGEYSSFPYVDLMTAFESVLRRSDAVIVAGFGWSDQGISTRLISYAHRQDAHLVILDGSKTSPAISKNILFDPRMLKPGTNGRRLIDLIGTHLSDLPRGGLFYRISKIVDCYTDW